MGEDCTPRAFSSLRLTMAKNTRLTKKKKDRTINPKKITQKSKQDNNQRKTLQWLKTPVALPKTKNTKQEVQNNTRNQQNKIKIMKNNQLDKLQGGN